MVEVDVVQRRAAKREDVIKSSMPSA